MDNKLTIKDTIIMIIDSISIYKIHEQKEILEKINAYFDDRKELNDGTPITRIEIGNRLLKAKKWNTQAFWYLYHIHY